MRNRQDPVWNFLPKLIPIIQTAGVNLVINGNMQNVADLKNLQSALNDNGGGKLSIMIAEAAEANPSVFSHSPKPQCLIIQELFEICQNIIKISWQLNFNVEYDSWQIKIFSKIISNEKF